MNRRKEAKKKIMLNYYRKKLYKTFIRGVLLAYKPTSYYGKVVSDYLTKSGDKGKDMKIYNWPVIEELNKIKNK